MRRERDGWTTRIAIPRTPEPRLPAVARSAKAGVSEMRLQKRDDLLPSFRRLLVADVVAQQLPSFRTARGGVDALELGVDQVEPFDRRQLVLEAGQSQVRARRDQRIDLRG